MVYQTQKSSKGSYPLLSARNWICSLSKVCYLCLYTISKLQNALQKAKRASIEGYVPYYGEEEEE